MEFVKIVKVELNEEEENAIRKVVDLIQEMWRDTLDCEMEDLWEVYGSNEDGWTCVEDTLRNLLNGGKTQC